MSIGIILLVVADMIANLRIHILEDKIKSLNERIDKLEKDKSNS